MQHKGVRVVYYSSKKRAEEKQKERLQRLDNQNMERETRKIMTGGTNLAEYSSMFITTLVPMTFFAVLVFIAMLM